MGRPTKVRPPPRAWQATGGGLGLLQAELLASLPQSKRLPYAADADMVAAAAKLNEAFEWFALWSVGEHKRAPHHEVRDWFNQVADQAAGLLHALGHDKPALADHGFQDVLTHLIVTKPHPSEKAPLRERHAQHKMEALARRVMPEAYVLAEQDGESDTGWEIANDCINKRLKATLELLQLLASRGTVHHASLVKKGGRDREEARKHLFTGLADQYRHLFGRLPAVPSATVPKLQAGLGKRQSLPKGPALDWFGALLDLVGARAAEALPHCQPGGAIPDPNREAMLAELMGLEAAAGRGKASDGLAHWIREAAAILAKRPPSAKPTAECIKIRSGRRTARTPIEDLFG